MRLIDKDATKADIEKFNRPLCDDYHMKDYVLNQIINDIEDMPTVEAIPMEFIKQLIEKFDCERGNAIKDTYAHILSALLEFWEFEQEAENDKG